jgi:cysteine synthase A
VDPEGSAFHDAWMRRDPSVTGPGSRIEGIGRPRVEPSFVGDVIDAMIAVPDAASIAAMRWCTDLTGRSVGGSTGTNLWGVLDLAADMRAAGEEGSIVTLLCDSGDRYGNTYYDDDWLREHGIDIEPWARTLDEFTATGTWAPPAALR